MFFNCETIKKNIVLRTNTHGSTDLSHLRDPQVMQTYWQDVRLLFQRVHGTKPVVVHVRISGFYDLIPPGDVGNEAGIIANVPADKAFGEQ